MLVRFWKSHDKGGQGSLDLASVSVILHDYGHYGEALAKDLIKQVVEEVMRRLANTRPEDRKGLDESRGKMAVRCNVLSLVELVRMFVAMQKRSADYARKYQKALEYDEEGQVGLPQFTSQFGLVLEYARDDVAAADAESHESVTRVTEALFREDPGLSPLLSDTLRELMGWDAGSDAQALPDRGTRTQRRESSNGLPPASAARGSRICPSCVPYGALAANPVADARPR